MSWTPADIATELWLDAADESTLYDSSVGGSIAASSGQVKRWEDKSGNGYHAITTATGPTRIAGEKNGNDVLRFSSGGGLSIGATNLLRNVGQATLFAVRKATTANSIAQVLSVRNQNATYTRAQLIVRSSGKSSLGARNTSTGTFVYLDGPDDDATIWATQAGTVDFPNTDAYLRVNGSIVVSNLSFLTTSAMEDQVSASTGIGCNPENNTQDFSGDIAELLIINTADVDTIQRTEGYLANKWDLPLPVDHPYLSLPPANISPPVLSFGETSWTGTTGTWDSQGSGPITYTWELRQVSDDTVVQSGTGTPSGSNPPVGEYYLYVEATNAGGTESSTSTINEHATAESYIAKLEAIGPVPQHVKDAIADFISGCRADASPVSGKSNWDAIRASCFLAGPSTLSGALVPLKGSAPTNNNFVDSDYHSVIGLKGNGSDKWLDTNHYGNEFDRINLSLSVYTTEPEGDTSQVLAGILPGTQNRFCLRSPNATSKAFYPGTGVNTTVPSKEVGFFGGSRHLESSAKGFYGNTLYSANITANSSNIPGSNFPVFRASGGGYTIARISFYHIGEAVDLVALDKRIKQYMWDIDQPSGGVIATGDADTAYTAMVTGDGGMYVIGEASTSLATTIAAGGGVIVDGQAKMQHIRKSIKLSGTINISRSLSGTTSIKKISGVVQ